MLRISLLFILFLNFRFISANDSIKRLISIGELKNAIEASDEILNKTAPGSIDYQHADSLKHIAQRIYIDFSRNVAFIDSLIIKRIAKFTPEQKKIWENNKWLEYRLIDGEKRYFKNAVGNLQLRLNQINDSLFPQNKTLDDFEKFKIENVNSIISKNYISGIPIHGQKFKVKYTVSLKPNVIPDGEIVRCWLPWPKENHIRQKSLKLVSSYPVNYIISKSNVAQRTIYFEQKTQKDKPIFFNINFEYISYAQHFDINKGKIKPYNTKTKLYQKNTSEQLPHIVFSDKIKNLADSITQKETNPYEIVKKLFYYISDNYIWSSALEYSIIPNIPHYVMENRKGDCGMKTLLFMTLARYKGIPVKWQSGWMMHPKEVNLHDWCEVYYENIGWVPLDMSFGLLDTSDIRVNEYFMAGIDAYRMIINDDISSPLFPKKNFLRSEPYDFQRGELEWKGGNLYFNQWNYDMKVEYCK